MYGGVQLDISPELPTFDRVSKISDYIQSIENTCTKQIIKELEGNKATKAKSIVESYFQTSPMTYRTNSDALAMKLSQDEASKIIKRLSDTICGFVTEITKTAGVSGNAYLEAGTLSCMGKIKATLNTSIRNLIVNILFSPIKSEIQLHHSNYFDHCTIS